MPKWLLPEHISDLLPADARILEELRRSLLDLFRGYGYELVMPPMLEYIESLLTGTGSDLDLRTLKLVDQLSGRTMGLRADITPQVTRIDAHLLNRSGIARLCYCGSVLHARPRGLHASREPILIGAEIYGHAGIEADIEICEMALGALALSGAGQVRIDLSHVGIARALLGRAGLAGDGAADVIAAVKRKDIAAIRASDTLDAEARAAFEVLCGLYGDASVVERARSALPADPAITQALDDLARLAASLPAARVTVDLADPHGFQYHTGITFAVYCADWPAAILRGGRYDEVGRAFGRARPATGFSLDLRELATLLPDPAPRLAIRAPWSDDAALHALVRRLRAEGEIVIQDFPGHEHDPDEFSCDRNIVRTAESWLVQALDEPRGA
ncbi:ATP phosphoribosyltransferase regulatory subunit [Derxia gummosa]|uniref:ATP phosphoribosyltransferase regulatory subunit n=1 Tax=Derxia gummosa DSM 723 TaxID=1121388 RepID=A0A8B6X6T2_9BURK|nr:ATP phosphoribosyltransferase regulatory subunit [Derxia gummosa]